MTYTTDQLLELALLAQQGYNSEENLDFLEGFSNYEPGNYESYMINSLDAASYYHNDNMLAPEFQGQTTFQNGTLVVSFGGTEQNADFLTNFNIAVGISPSENPQVQAAMNYYSAVLAHYNIVGFNISNVILTGHSLGGYLAQAVHNAQIGVPVDPIGNPGGAIITYATNVVTFNSPNLDEDFISNENITDSIVHIYTNPAEWAFVPEQVHNLDAYSSDNVYYIMNSDSFNYQEGFISGHHLSDMITLLDAGAEIITLSDLVDIWTNEINVVSDELYGTPAFIQEFLEAYAKYKIPQLYADQALKSSDWANQCFTANASIAMADGSEKTIDRIIVGDEVLSFDDNGHLVSGIVKRLFINTTQEFIQLVFEDDRPDLTTTPGHRFLTATGMFAEIGQLIKLGNGNVNLVDLDGSLINAKGIIHRYSQSTAHLYDCVEKSSTSVDGNLALDHSVSEGWKTYNFEVSDTHTYIANKVRVHNDSILTFLKETDRLVSVNTDFTDMIALRDIDGEYGAEQVVVFDGIRSNGEVDTRLEVTTVFTPPADTDIFAIVDSILASNPDLQFNPTDPDDLVDSLEEAIESLGWSSIRYANGVVVPTEEQITGDPENALQTLQEIIDLINSLDPMIVQLESTNGNTINPLFEVPSALEILSSTLQLPVDFVISPGLQPMTLADLVSGELISNTSFSLELDEGITIDDITREQLGDDLVLTIDNGDGTTSTWTLEGVYADGNADEIASINFADGSSLELEDIAEAGVVADGIVNGTEADDTLDIANADPTDGDMVTQGDDTINGLGGNDTIDGAGGNDTIDGGAGTNTLRGGNGLDRFIAGIGLDFFDGGANFDTVTYEGSNAGILIDLQDASLNTGDAAGDTFFSIEEIIATSYDDIIRGNALSSMLVAGAGDDIIFARGGDDIVSGDAGSDELYGQGGDDELSGGADDDLLNGGAGADILDGGSGNDAVSYVSSTIGLTVDLQIAANNTGEAIGDTYISIENLEGSQHNDSLRGNGVDNLILGRSGDDFIYGRGGDDALYGGIGNDELFGQTGIDILDGGAGDDRLDGGAEGDTLNGDTGYDYADYGSASSGVTASLSNTAINTGDAAGDIYISIEGLIGSQHDDYLYGNGGDNILSGLAGTDRIFGGLGADTIFGGVGNDILRGEAGDDILTGGAGNDFFVFMGDGQDGLDTITDFASGADKISLDDSGMFSIVGVVLNANEFKDLANGNQDADDIFIYNSATGALFFDADGLGGAAAIRIANLGANTALDHTDFTVF